MKLKYIVYKLVVAGRTKKVKILGTRNAGESLIELQNKYDRYNSFPNCNFQYKITSYLSKAKQIRNNYNAA